jgi:hypothetical protein
MRPLSTPAIGAAFPVYDPRRIEHFFIRRILDGYVRRAFQPLSRQEFDASTHRHEGSGHASFVFFQSLV